MGRALPWKKLALWFAVVCAAMVAVDFAIHSPDRVREWLDQRHFEARLKDDTRTWPRRFVVPKAAGPLNLFQSPVTDGFRWVAMPSFSGWYALALEPVPGGDAIGRIWFNSRLKPLPVDDPRGEVPVRTFHIPAAAYQTFLSKADRLVRGWGGDKTICMDGVLVAFEIAKDGHALSGSGNAGCSAHYRALSVLVLETVRQFGQGSETPNNPYWIGPDGN
jgi:hypothetical protein